MHINKIINNNKDICNTKPVVISDKIKNIHKKLIDAKINSFISINKVHIENNSASISKKTHKKLFNNVLKQIISNNKQTNNALIDTDKCKKAPKKLFNSVLKQLISNDKVHMQTNNIDKCTIANDKLFNNLVNNMHTQTNNKCVLAYDMLVNSVISNNKVRKQNSAGHKDSTANIINKACNNDTINDNLLHKGIIYFANKAISVEKVINKHQKDIACTLSNMYHNDNDSKFNKLKEVSDKINLLLNALQKTIFNQKLAKEQIILDAKVSINVKRYTPIVDNKYICISEIYEYLSDNIDYIHDNIKNKKCNELLTLLKSIREHIFISIKRMYAHDKNKKSINANNTNKKITNANNANNANKKITNANNTNKKIINENNSNKKINNENNLNKKIMKKI